ncbi:VCBS repeat-containing protein, partial [bacterium]|nr:VCBS repeat-containing protein [bacterium]
ESWKADTRISGGSDHEDMGALFFDAEGDGDLDLYVVSGGVESEKGSSNYRDRLYLNDGKGKFGLSDGGALPEVMESGSCVVAADYDGDGDLDLFVGGRIIPGEYPMAPSSHLLRNDSKEGRVQFVDVTSEAAPALQNLGMVTSALWSDVNGDGDSDLLITAEWGPVRWFRNNDGKFTENEDSGISSLSGWWNGIVGGDLDHDGDIDYVVSNFGLNTKYHPSTKKPAILYYGDFSGNGERRIVEAKATIKGTLPVRGFSCSSSAIPSVLEKMGSKKPFHNFAIKALDEIYTEARLEKAQRFEVNELRSGAFINDGEGKFAFRALPALAQAAPGFGMSLGDINGDAHLDLYMVQNFFSPQPETGRMHGAMSILMTGRGDGMFDSVWPEKSGLVVPGDAKGLVQFSKGRFLISQNNGETLLFRPNYDRSQQCHIRLIGQSKNRRAIGARISCSLEGVLLGSFEVYGGSGYLSSGTSIISIPHEGEGMIEVKVEWPDGSKSNHQIPAKEGGEIRKP